MYGLIDLATRILIIGAVIHWALGFFGSGHNDTVMQIRTALDRVYQPMLGVVRGFVKPIQLSSGNAVDLSHLILIIALVLIRRFAFWLL